MADTVDSLSFINDPNGNLTDLKISMNGGTKAFDTLVTAGNVQFNNTPASGPVVSRTVDSRLKEWVSVKDFGAKGNGSADDTTAIQNAINSGATLIYFPPPTSPTASYKITSSIQINNTVTIAGDNKWVTRVSSYTTNIPFFIVNAPFVVFENLVFEGYDPKGNSNYNNTGIILYASDTVIKDCVFSQLSIGICNSIAYLSPTQAPDEQNIHRCRFSSCKYGVQSLGRFINSRIDGYSIFSGCKCAVSLYDDNNIGPPTHVTEGAIIENCLIYACGDVGLGKGAIDVNQTDYTYIRNCSIDLCTNSVITMTNSKYCAITNCYLSTFSAPANVSGAIISGDCSELLIANCQFYSCLKWGLEINGVSGFADVNITDCSFWNNNLFNSGSGGSGDCIINGVDNVVIRGCNLLTTTGTGLAINNSAGTTSVYVTETKIVGTILKSPMTGTKIPIVLTNCKNNPTRIAGIATFSSTSILIALPSNFTVLTGQTIVVTATNSSSFEYITAGIQFTSGIYYVKLIRSSPGSTISVNYIAEVFEV